MNMDEISKLELDLLMVFFSFSDQWGNVKMDQVCEFTRQKMNLVISNKPFKLTQEHMDVLIAHQMVPDIGKIVDDMKTKKPKRRKLKK